MEPIVIVTVAVAGVFVVTLAAYLTVVAADLVRSRRAIVRLIGAISDIGAQSKSLAPTIEEINRGLTALDNAVGGRDRSEDGSPETGGRPTQTTTILGGPR